MYIPLIVGVGKGRGTSCLIPLPFKRPLAHSNQYHTVPGKPLAGFTGTVCAKASVLETSRIIAEPPIIDGNPLVRNHP